MNRRILFFFGLFTTVALLAVLWILIYKPFKTEKLEYLPVRFEDFSIPAKSHGIWPFGARGQDSSSHNEGHGGWDFELKKGSKVYAVSDLLIDEIHDGDHQFGSEALRVIEATTRLQGKLFHITYHSVINIENDVTEGAIIKAGSPLAEAAFPMDNNCVSTHFGIFPPNDSIGSCPTDYFSENAKQELEKILKISIDVETGKPYPSACIGKISREIFLRNYPEKKKYLRGGEQFE